MSSSANIGVLTFIMPFESLAAVSHAEKLVTCIAPACEHLFLVGDKRINIGGLPKQVQHLEHLHNLHRLEDIQPKFWSAFLWFFKLVRVLLRACIAVYRVRCQVDFVVCFLGVYYTPILLCSRLLGKKTISFEPGNVRVLLKANYGKNTFGNIILRVLYKLQTMNHKLVDVCGIESLHEIEQAGLKPYLHKVRVVNLYVDTNLYREITPFENRHHVVGFIGRLISGKGVMAFLDAALMLRSSGVSFHIVGDGPLRADIQAMLQHSEYSHVKFSGWADRQTTVEYLNTFRLLVLPSIGEGLPNIILEALACGTAVLATPVGSIPAVVRHQETGYILFDPSPDTIAQAIQEAINDVNLAAIAVHGRNLILSNYSLEAVSSRWAEILSELEREE